MSYRTNFKCFQCGKPHYTKQNLTEHNGHLLCRACLDKAPKQEIKFFEVVYQMKRGKIKTTTLRVDSAQEAEEYTMTKLKAGKVLSIKSQEEAEEEITKKVLNVGFKEGDFTVSHTEVKFTCKPLKAAEHSLSLQLRGMQVHAYYASKQDGARLLAVRAHYYPGIVAQEVSISY